MEKQIIQEGNKLIAEFLGWTFRTPDKHNINGVWEKSKEYNYDLAYELQFHFDWYYLMSVVEHIENLEEADRNQSPNTNETVPRYCNPYRVDILGRNVVEILAFGEDSIAMINNDQYTKIEAVWLACVEFVKWYNKQ